MKNSILRYLVPLLVLLQFISSSLYATYPRPGGGNQPDTPACGTCPPCNGGAGRKALKARPRYFTISWVIPYRGSAINSVVDLSLPGKTFGWSHERTYDSRLVDGGTELPGENGARWASAAQGPYLHEDENDDIEVYVDASTKRVFTKNGSTFTAPVDYEATLTIKEDGMGDRSDEEYWLEHTRTGEIFIFYGLDLDVLGYQAGRLKERTNRNFDTENTTGIQYSYNVDGMVSCVTSSQGWEIDYEYYNSGSEDGLLKKVNVLDGTTPTPNSIQTAEYTYYDNATSVDGDVGSDGDLAQVKISRLASDGSTWITSYTQYRYYKAGGEDDGEEHQLKIVLEPDAVERIMKSGNANVNTAAEIMQQPDSYTVANGNSIADYASRSYTYYKDTLDTSMGIATPWSGTENLQTKYGGSNATEYDALDGHGRVKTATIGANSSGCCGGSGGSGITYYYFYMDLNGGNSSDSSEVVKIVVEDAEESDGDNISRRIYGLNSQGVLLRETLIEDPTETTLKAWCSSIILDSNRRVTERRMPSAHTIVDADADVKKFLDPEAGTNDADTLNDDDGLIYLTTFTETSGTLTIANRVKEGEGATNPAHYISYTKYGNGTSNPDWAVLETRTYDTKETASPESNGILTSYAYTFHDTSTKTQIKKLTTTLPSIADTQNGSNSSTTTEVYYDDHGRLRWTKDGEGYVDYYSYHPDTGGLAFVMTDVNTSGTLDSDIKDGSAGKWIAWSGSAGLTRASGLPTALQLKQKVEFDDQGRRTKSIDPRGGEHYTVYEDERVLQFPYWESTEADRLVPIVATKINDAGQVTERYDIDPDQAASPSGTPTGLSSEPDEDDYLSWTKFNRSSVDGKLETIDRYHNITDVDPQVTSTNFNQTQFRYDDRGRHEYTIQVVSGTSGSNGVEQVTQNVYDLHDRIIEILNGVSDGASNIDTTLPTRETITEISYDGGDVGDGHVTKRKKYHGTGDNDFTGANLKRDYLGRLRGVEPFYMNGSTETDISPYVVYDVKDWRGYRTAVGQYSSKPSWDTVVGDDDFVSMTATNRETRTEVSYDDLGRAYQSRRYDGSNYLKTDFYYDRNSRRVAIAPANQAARELAYDGVGRQYQNRVVAELESTKYSSGAFQYRAPVPQPSRSSFVGSNDKVFDVSHLEFDASGNVTERHLYEMTHNDTSSPGIDTIFNTDYVRRSIYRWYDDADRLSATADYGSGDTASGDGTWKYASVPSRPTNPPTASSDTALLTTFQYDDYEHLGDRQDSVTVWSTGTVSHKTKTFYDKLRRKTYVAENHANFDPDTANTTGDATDKSKDKVTAFEYNGLNRLSKLIAKDQDANGNDSDDQETEYLYEDAVNASRATSVIYPDGSSSDKMAYVFNTDGSLSKRTNQRGTVIDYTYSNLRQLELAKATTLGGADGHIRSIKSEYDSIARLEKVTSFANSDGTGTVRNQVQFEYNDLSQITKSYQSHEGAVNVNTSPNVEYAYDDTADGNNVFTRNHRLESVTHPSTRVAFYDYNTDDDDFVHHRRSLPYAIHKDDGNGTQYVKYDYNGNGRLAIVDYQVPDVKLDLYQGTAKTYAGYDRFGRIKDLFWDWYKTGETDEIARIKHGYDYTGNRLWREDVVANDNSKDHDELYTYDGLFRASDMERGDLNGAHTSISSKNFAQEWTILDALGNWSTFKEDTNGNGTWDLDQDRTHNAANEIGTIEVWSNPSHDAAGNMTTVPDPANLSNSLLMTYDAWNRLVKVTNQSLQTVAEFEYDGLNRRIIKTDRESNPDITYDYFYSTRWQILEVHKGGDDVYPLEEFIWHPYYIDALAVRFYDPETDGSPDDHYFMQDANINVTAVTDSSGNVQERYQYSTYGEMTVLDADFTVDSNGTDIGNSITYTGREFDSETGLFHYRNRYYGSQLGRFVSRDPILYFGSRWNLVEYVASNPLIHVDPWGLRNFWNPFSWDQRSDPEQGWAGYFNPFSGEVVDSVVEGGILGTAQGGANLVNGVQNGITGALDLPANAINFTTGTDLPTIGTHDWSRDLIIEEPGEPGSWTDSHGWSMFGGEIALDLVTGKAITKLCPKGGGVVDDLADLFTNRLNYRFIGTAAQQKKYLDDLADLQRQYGKVDNVDEVGIVNGKIAYGSFDPATGRITIYRGGDDLTKFEELLHWKKHNERLKNSQWTQDDFLKRWNDPNDSARDSFRKQYYDAGEAEITRSLRDDYGWVER